ncbi:bud site selection protein [Phytophthora boehmeriae]|uniref:Bud site selection protein n=1 Tax=Phytophthora boehmeriae TaxID=109152 RepID=A0A8T1WZI4_9STRA|nr:bud site selection protein [Phytophthora boehmeriae]
MTSKLEYLQRYMSSKSGEAGDGSKKKKRVKKSKTAKTLVLGTRMVDADDAWEQSAPSREAIEHKWEQDGAEDERPLVVAADGEDLVDPQDLPVYVDSDKYLGELQAKQKHKKEEDGDLSPPQAAAEARIEVRTDAAVGAGVNHHEAVVIGTTDHREGPLDGDLLDVKDLFVIVVEVAATVIEGVVPPLYLADRHEVVKMPAQPNSPKKAKRGPSTKAGSDHDDKDREEEKKAGLFTADEFEKQRKLAAKRKDMLRGVDSSDMGANAETVYRDKRGRKLDMLNEMVRQQEVLEGKRKREAREEYEWGTGAVQKRERKSQLELMDQMKDAPFARHEDDEELERMRRERVRAFDPIHSKVFQEDPLADEGKSKKKKSKKDKKEKKESVKTKPKYAGPPAPPNRFGIQPGYRWDGVVRGTNWEEKIMMKQNASTAISEEAYKYAVADM